MTETRGTGQLHHVFEGFEPWFGEIRTRPNGTLVADRLGPTTTFALINLQERGQLFVGPGVEVYEGMVVGVNARQEDMDVNITKEKKLNNIRSSTAEETVQAGARRADGAGAVTRVHPRRRVHRGHAEVGAHPQGRARRNRARPLGQAGEGAGLTSRSCDSQ